MSIETGSIRIGNYVTHSEKGVIQITAYGVHLFEKERLCKVKSIEPILISKDWLIKLGFKKWSTHTELYLNAGHFGIEYYEGMICLDIEGQIMILKHVKYVHHIQNFYHSLTGNELTLSKPF